MATRPKVTDWLDDEYKLTRLKGWARRGLSNDQIADQMEIGRSTFYRWMAENKDFRDALKEDKEYCDDKVENALYQAALDGNVSAQIFYLKNRRRNDWRDKQDLEVSGDLSISEVIRKSRERRERLENEQ